MCVYIYIYIAVVYFDVDKYRCVLSPLPPPPPLWVGT